jgi:GNAT superfamily N-acetyltransferase
MDDRLVVRPIDAGDLGGAVGVLLGGTRSPEAERPGDLASYLAAVGRIRGAGGDVLVAVLDGSVIGICQVALLFHFQHAGGQVAELESVHVAATHRSAGVGQALVEHAVAWARDRGCYRVQLTSHRSREGAHRFYERLGFQPTHVGYKLDLDGVAEAAGH